MTTEWSALCAVAQRHELSVVTSSGKTVKGVCDSTGVTEMTLSHSGKLVKIDRSEVSRIRMLLPDKHRLLPALGDQVGWMLGAGVLILASPAAPFGIVLIPASLTYGAVAAPVCAIHDLARKVFEKKQGVEIKVL
jgi:hypothetical protein